MEFSLAYENWITIGGAAITIGGALFTLKESRKAKNYSDQIKQDVEKLSLHHVCESLRRCQDAIRRLPASNTKKRGFDLQSELTPIWAHFDTALSSHVLSDHSEIREIVVDAQSILQSYRKSNADGSVDPSAASSRLQDALAGMNSKIYKIEGKR